MDGISIILFGIGFISALLGVVVIARDQQSTFNLSFLVFALLVSFWIVSNGLFRVVDGNLIFPVALLSYAAAFMLSASFVYFTSLLRKNSEERLTRALILYSVPAAILSGLPNVIATGVNEAREIVTTDFASLYGLGLSINLLIGVWNIIIFFKKADNLRARNQATIMLTGFALSVVGGVMFNVVLPIGFDNYQYVYAGPASAIFFVISIAYAILKHRLFDLRLIVARSIAYISSLSFVGLIAALSLILAASVLSNEPFSTLEITAVTSITLILALLYQPFKRFFDNLTNRIFFREAYDSQEVLDKLSSLLATEIELDKIVSESSDLLMDALRPTQMRFAVFKDGETFIDHHLGTKSRKVLDRKHLRDINEFIVVRDDSAKGVKRILDHYDADVLLKLRANEETVGVILMGPKQSGTVYSKQDIDLLTITEKELAIAVQNARYFEQIQEFNVKLQEEIKQATAELRASNTKLKELDEAKDEFISMASHQLRTPLTSVKGYISMVIEGDTGKIKPGQKKLLDEAFASSQRMVYLIADLLNVSRLKTGKFVIEPVEVNLADLVGQEINQLKATARSRKLKLKYDKPKAFPEIWLDETKIRQVIMNFVDNAIYYTPAGGEINITLTAKKEVVEFRVKDNGIGVPKEEQAKLFAKFYRAGNAKKARPDGTGLGLYMAQRVVSAQGGSIIFESEEGKGSTFGFSFPLRSVGSKQNQLSE